MFPTVAARCDTEELLKFTGEVTVVVESDILRDLADGSVAVHQYLARTSQSVADNKACWCLLKDSTKAAFNLTN